MQYRKFGRANDEISVIGLGAEHFKDVSAQDVAAVVSKAIDSGINYIDCICGEPEIRDNYGYALAGGYRDRVMISCHFGNTIKDGQYYRTRDQRLSMEYFHDFLRRVNTDYVDVLMLHYVDDESELEQMMEPNGAIDQAIKLKQEGKARFIALSSHDVTTSTRAVRTGQLDALMFPVNPAFDTLSADVELDALWKEHPYRDSQGGGIHLVRRELHHACLEHGTAIIAMKVYAGGWLFWKENPSGVVLSPVQCISYALSQPGVATALAGCKTVAELDAALAYLNASPEERDYSRISKSARWSLSATCMYCNHCLPCTSMIDIGRVTRLADAYEVSHASPIADEYASLDAHASDCTQCGECLQRCPFGVDIISNMDKAVGAFGR